MSERSPDGDETLNRTTEQDRAEQNETKRQMVRGKTRAMVSWDPVDESSSLMGYFGALREWYSAACIVIGHLVGDFFWLHELFSDRRS